MNRYKNVYLTNDKQVRRVFIGEIIFNKNDTRKVYMYNYENPNEHFHLKGKQCESCVMIYSSKFFYHDDNHKPLKKCDCEILDKWLREKNKEVDTTMTNWEVIKYIWKVLNPDELFIHPSIPCDDQPDYTLLE